MTAGLKCPFCGEKWQICIMQAVMEKGLVEDKDIARSVKQEFDKKHGPTWHCVVGRHFGKTSRLTVR